MSISLGLLGVGYLGKELVHQFPQAIAWGTYRRENSPPDPHRPYFFFQWDNPQTWSNLPETPTTLVLTIPSVLQDPTLEMERVEAWGHWMRHERPQCQNLIYISSTRVYPSSDGVWKESDIFEPDQLGGKIRLKTEQALEKFFKLWVVRPGGIYGPGRNVGQRILDQRPITKSRRPIHRIHVKDLAALVHQIAASEGSPFCVNAVDEEAQPSIVLLEWLLETKRLLLAPDFKIHYREEGAVYGNNRFISNARLLHEMGFALQYPSFREGLAELFLENHNLDENSH